MKVGKPHIIPDAIFLLTDLEGKQHLFAVEVYNGHDTKRVVRQLKKHVQAQEEGSISQSYGLNIAYKVLLVFDQGNAMQSAIKRVKATTGFSEMGQYFAFNSLEKVKENFAMGWEYPNGRKGNIFLTHKS